MGFNIQLGLINGMSVGIEFMKIYENEEEETGESAWMMALDVVILRIIFIF